MRSRKADVPYAASHYGRIATDPLDVAVDAARAAGALLREKLAAPRSIAEKRAFDLVTDADRASEALIIARLREAFPQSGILGEETGRTVGSDGTRWIIDPLDGTTNYAHRYPIFCVSIAYEVEGEVTAGVVYAPMLDELYSAAKGRGAHCNGAPISVSAVAEVREALVCTGFRPGAPERNLGAFTKLSYEAQGVRRDGAAALDLAFTACGRFDGFWEHGLAPWDVAAGALIVAEAGGTVSALDGSPFGVDGPSIVATNGVLHAALRAAAV